MRWFPVFTLGGVPLTFTEEDSRYWSKLPKTQSHRSFKLDQLAVRVQIPALLHQPGSGSSGGSIGHV